MLAVTDEPDAPREAGPPDRDYVGSGWLASALSSSDRPAATPSSATPPGPVPTAQDASGDTAPAGDASDDEKPGQKARKGWGRGAPHHKHLAKRLGRRGDRPAPDDTAEQASDDTAAPDEGAAARAAGPEHERDHRHAAPDPADHPASPTDGHEGPVADPEPEQPLSPLGAPPLPATPTGAVRWWTAGATLASAVLLSVAGFAGVGPLAAAALFVVAVTAWGWPTLVDLPSPRGSTTTVALGGTACVVAVALSRDEPLLQWLALALAGAVVGEFVHQLARRDGRPRLVECVTGTLAGVVVLASMSALLALPRTPVGGGGVLLVAVPVAIGLALQALPVPGRVASLAGVALAALLAGLAANFLEPTVLAGLVTGLVAGAVAVMLHRLLSVLPPAGSAPAWLALALAPLASTGMVGYVALRLLVG
jgi:hypothetical protein